MTDPVIHHDRIVADLRSLLAKATKRPWRVFDSEYGNSTIAVMKGDRPGDRHKRWPEIIKWPGFDGTDVGKRYDRANAELIVAVVNALPTLLNALEASTRVIAREAGRAQPGADMVEF